MAPVTTQMVEPINPLDMTPQVRSPPRGIGYQISLMPADTAFDVVKIGSNVDTGQQMVSFDVIEKCGQSEVFHMSEAPLVFWYLMAG